MVKMALLFLLIVTLYEVLPVRVEADKNAYNFDDQYRLSERQYAADLARRIVRVLCFDRETDAASRGITNNGEYFVPVSLPVSQKRNPELINSLLGLPKNMNDAGR